MHECVQFMLQITGAFRFALIISNQPLKCLKNSQVNQDLEAIANNKNIEFQGKKKTINKIILMKNGVK